VSNEHNGRRRDFELQRHKILLWGGLAGMFGYVLIVELLGKPFHYEFVIGFLAMMGIGLLQGIEKK
jgi:hypothetical protein